MDEVKITIPLNALANAIALQLAPMFADLQKQPQATVEDGYLTRKATAKLLNVSLPTLTNYTKQGLIPGYRFGVRVLYQRQDVTKALQAIKGGGHA